MLNGIARCISPELLYSLMRMGHGDEIALVDVDFPAYTYGQQVIRADGVDMMTLLAGMLPLFPLDTYVEKPVVMMSPVGEQPVPAVWTSYTQSIARHYPAFEGFVYLDRYAFYNRVKSCHAVVVTGEADGNLILKKGVVSGCF